MTNLLQILFYWQNSSFGNKSHILIMFPFFTFPSIKSAIPFLVLLSCSPKLHFLFLEEEKGGDVFHHYTSFYSTSCLRPSLIRRNSSYKLPKTPHKEERSQIRASGSF